LQRAQLLAAYSVGIAIIQLRQICRRFDLDSDLDAALEAFARGSCATAAGRLADVEHLLASRFGPAALRARGLILVISQALTQHSLYFDAGEPG
jgi:hypothetical protein